MLFPTHLVAAYLLGKRLDWPWTLVVAGAALPDLIDKPLPAVGVVDLYQSIGHSLLLFVGVSVVVLVRRTWLPFWAGWASHLLLDALHMVVNGRPGDLRFLAWPLIEHTPAVDLPPLEFFVYYLGTPASYVEVVIWAAFGYVLLTSDRIGWRVRSSR